MSNEQTAMTKVEDYGGLSMVMTPNEAFSRLQELQAFVAKVMVKDTDYGVIPGTEKPTLLQPGAQKLSEIYGFAADYEDTGSVMDWNGNFFLFRKRCVLTSRRDGRFVGGGIGSCNSRESRYGFRWVFDNELPKHIDKSTLQSRTGRSRKTGRNYTQYKLPNDDVCSLVNTIEKMACKRALIHAVIGATRSAGIFTQDVEDLPPEAFGDEERESPSQAAEPSKPRIQDAEFVEEKADGKPPPDYQARADVFASEIKAAVSEEGLSSLCSRIKQGMAGAPAALVVKLRKAYSDRAVQIAQLAAEQQEAS